MIFIIIVQCLVLRSYLPHVHAFWGLIWKILFRQWLQTKILNIKWRIETSVKPNSRFPIGFDMKIPEGRQTRLWLGIPALRHNPGREFHLRADLLNLSRDSLCCMCVQWVERIWMWHLTREAIGSTTDVSGGNSGLCWSEQTTWNNKTFINIKKWTIWSWSTPFAFHRG